MFWPSPEVLEDLVVSERAEDDGSLCIEFSAPEGTECSRWLELYSQTPELQEMFRKHMMQAILSFIERPPSEDKEP